MLPDGGCGEATVWGVVAGLFLAGAARPSLAVAGLFLAGAAGLSLTAESVRPLLGMIRFVGETTRENRFVGPATSRQDLVDVRTLTRTLTRPALLDL